MLQSASAFVSCSCINDLIADIMGEIWFSGLEAKPILRGTDHGERVEHKPKEGLEAKLLVGQL